jgi:nitrous oxidase accessory protein NosD
MNTATTSNESQTPKSADGYAVGQSSTDLVGFWGATPIAQPSGAAQAAVIDGSTGTAAPTNGIAALTGTYNSTLLINAIATLAAQGNAIRNALVSAGIIAGS